MITDSCIQFQKEIKIKIVPEKFMTSHISYDFNQEFFWKLIAVFFCFSVTEAEAVLIGEKIFHIHP
jgi:hypothetical protein